MELIYEGNGQTNYENIDEECCVGCSITHMCYLPITENGINCPCRDCIIKPMCNEECHIFSDYWDMCHTHKED